MNTGPSNDLPNFPKSQLDGPVQGTTEAVVSIVDSTRLAFSHEMDKSSSRSNYDRILSSGVGRNYNRLALCLRHMQRLETDDFAHIKHSRTPNNFRRRLLAQLEGQRQSLYDCYASIPGQFPLVRRVREGVLNTTPQTSRKYNPDFLDNTCYTTDNACIQDWRKALIACARRMNDA